MSAEFDDLGDMNFPGVLRLFWSKCPGHFQGSQLVRRPKPLDSNGVSVRKLKLALRSAASLCISNFNRRPKGAEMHKEKSLGVKIVLFAQLLLQQNAHFYY
jgi:hypothetical protein